MDAGIACRNAKRHYDFVRPVTASHHLYADQEIQAWAGPGLGVENMDVANGDPTKMSVLSRLPLPNTCLGIAPSALLERVLLHYSPSQMSFSMAIR